MNKSAFLAALFLATGCAVQTAPAFGPDPVDPTPDAAPAPDAGVDSPTPVPPGPDAQPVTPDGGTGPEATTPPAPDAGPSGPDALPPTTDAGPDVVVAPDATDAGPVAPDAGGDAGPDADPTTDAGSDAADGAVVPLCTSPLPACAKANDTDALVRSTFTKPCTVENERKCGGVYRGVVETLPMICRAGQWRLAGSWSGSQWMPLYECTVGCGQAGKTCGP